MHALLRRDAREAPMKISQPGFYVGVGADAYHADPCPEPSLSSSLAKVLLTESPLKARVKHPRLSPGNVDEEEADPKFDLGTVCHALLLEGVDLMEVVDAKDWRTNAAKEKRAAARAAGKIAVLTHQSENVNRMLAVALEFISQSEIASSWDDAESEVVGIAREGDVWLRCMFDRITRDRTFIMDYKTTGSGVDPVSFGRTMQSLGYPVQEAMYRRIARDLGGVEAPRFVFLAQSDERPFECALYGCTPAMQEIADAEVERAIQTWRGCVTTGNWPSHGGRVHWLDPAPWMLKAHEQRIIAGAA